MSSSIDIIKEYGKISKSEIFQEYLYDHIIPITVMLLMVGLLCYPTIIDLLFVIGN
jgi:hypothetical protein